MNWIPNIGRVHVNGDIYGAFTFVLTYDLLTRLECFSNRKKMPIKYTKWAYNMPTYSIA
jgi:hypothetical protein